MSTLVNSRVKNVTLKIIFLFISVDGMYKTKK